MTDRLHSIRDAIRRMQAEEVRLTAWKAAPNVGDDELDAGQSVPYTAATLDGITRSAKKTMHSAPGGIRTVKLRGFAPYYAAATARAGYKDAGGSARPSPASSTVTPSRMW